MQENLVYGLIISVTAWGAQFPGMFNLVHQAQPLTLVQVCRVAQDARASGG
jgi:hypothetical protein